MQHNIKNILIMKEQILKADRSQIDEGLLVLRILLGISFIIHGYPKLTGGFETWTFLGGTMKNIGIDFMPAYWGFLCAIAELFGGLFLALGLLTRISAVALFFTMMIATIFHFAQGDSYDISSHAIECGIVFLGFMFMGAGKYSLDYRFFQR